MNAGDYRGWGCLISPELELQVLCKLLDVGTGTQTWVLGRNNTKNFFVQH